MISRDSINQVLLFQLADLDGPGRIKFWLAMGSKFRRYFCFWVGPAKVTLVVNHPSTVKAVMKTSGKFRAPVTGKQNIT